MQEAASEPVLIKPTLMCGRTQPAHAYGSFPSTPTVPANPKIPPIPPIADWDPPQKESNQNPSKILIICERSQSRTMGSILISPPLIFGVRAGAIARWTGSPAFSRGSRDRSSRDAPVVEIPPPSRIVLFNYLAGSPRFGARLAQSARNSLHDTDIPVIRIP